MKPVRFLHPAEEEMLDAAKYYEIQASGLGGDFLDSIDSATLDIGTHPERWPVLRGCIRRRLIPRFPYALLYRVDSDEIVIIATMHLHRHPDYWTKRIQSE